MQASLQKIYNNQIIIERQKNKQTDKNIIVQNVIEQIDVIRHKYNIETSYYNRQALFERHTRNKMSQNNIQTLSDKNTIVKTSQNRQTASDKKTIAIAKHHRIDMRHQKKYNSKNVIEQQIDVIRQNYNSKTS